MCRDIITNSNITNYLFLTLVILAIMMLTLLSMQYMYMSHSTVVLCTEDWYGLSPLKTIYKVFHHFHFHFAAYWIPVNINM